jgi:hypothetical protein
LLRVISSTDEKESSTIHKAVCDVFNHPNLGIPNLNWSASDFGNLAETIYGGRILKIKLTYSF